MSYPCCLLMRVGIRMIMGITWSVVVMAKKCKLRALRANTYGFVVSLCLCTGRKCW